MRSCARCGPENAHLRPGRHTYPPDGIEPSAARPAGRTKLGPGMLGQKFEGLLVGWFQREHVDSLIQVTVAQTAVVFPLDELEEIQSRVGRQLEIVSAWLTFDEHAEVWTSASGLEQHKAGCVAHLGIATVDWAGQPDVDAPEFPNVISISAPSGSSREWEVGGHISAQLRDKAVPRYGYVLRGGNDNPRGDDNTSCLSTISNIRLRVTYVIPN